MKFRRVGLRPEEKLKGIRQSVLLNHPPAIAGGGQIFENIPILSPPLYGCDEGFRLGGNIPNTGADMTGLQIQNVGLAI